MQLPELKRTKRVIFQDGRYITMSKYLRSKKEKKEKINSLGLGPKRLPRRYSRVCADLRMWEEPTRRR